MFLRPLRLITAKLFEIAVIVGGLILLALLLAYVLPGQNGLTEDAGGRTHSFSSLLSNLQAFRYSTSYKGLDIRDLSFEAVKNSFLILVVSTLFIILISIVSGYRAGVLESGNVHIRSRKLRTAVSRVMESMIFVLSSIPSYIIAILLYILVPDVHPLILAVLSTVLGSNLLSELMLHGKYTVIREGEKQYLENALVLGYSPEAFTPERSNAGYHLFRSMLPGMLMVIRSKLPALLGNILIVELIFSIRGLSSLLLIGFVQSDIPLVFNSLLLALVLNYSVDLLLTSARALFSAEGGV